MQKLQNQSQKMQETLQHEEVVSEVGQIKILILGNQVVKNGFVNGENNTDTVTAFNNAIQKTQTLASKKLLELQ